jgi:hypothetical protein
VIVPATRVEEFLASLYNYTPAWLYAKEHYLPILLPLAYISFSSSYRTG